MSTGAPTVVYVLPDKTGGVLTVVRNLLQFRRPDEFSYRAVLTRNLLDGDTASAGGLPVDREDRFEYALPIENLHAVITRLRRLIGRDPGVLVCSDWLEMVLVSMADPGRTVVQLLHGDYDYYYDLAATHQDFVHAFVASSRIVYERLLARLPHRADSIFWLSYGIPISDRTRRASGEPIRLLYLGRLDKAKGVLDLAQIDRALARDRLDVEWTIVGSGPEAESLGESFFKSPRVRWLGELASRDIPGVLERSDLFVLPSRAEGLSVAMIEAMGAGVVPIVTDLPSMGEVIDGSTTGLRVPAGDTSLFADAIATLARDRPRLEAMSRTARALIADRFDIRSRASAYQDLYSRWRELVRPRPARSGPRYGSRLDRPWIPNSLVKWIRTRSRPQLAQ